MNNDNINSALDALKLALTEDGTVTSNSSIRFTDRISGKGILWAGSDYTKQLTFVENPDRLFVSENLDLAKDRKITVNGVEVLSGTTLGTGVVESNLREVGRLRGLIVDGSVAINNYLHFDANTDRLGIGTEEPNGTLSVAEDGIEVIIGTEDFTKGVVGTFASHSLLLKTDNTTRIEIGSGGDVKLGHPNNPPIKVSVNGKLSIGVNNADPDVDLHVRGNIKFNNKKHMSGSEAPKGGTYNQGDIVWNDSPKQHAPIGWVCTKAGNPGLWSGFGLIN